MGETTKISWCNHTWNPWLGCTKVSPGCRSCYAERIETRARRDFSIVRRAKNWTNPFKWQKEASEAGEHRFVFTCSMSDFFHEDADEWRDEAWGIIRMCPNLTFQILTKRPERIKQCLPGDWFPGGYPNVWLGASVELPLYVSTRIYHLLQTPAPVHFLSCEPLLGPLDLSGYLGPTAISWVIVGGESGPSFREMDISWATSLKDQCEKADVPFWGKQRAGYSSELPLLIDGREWKARPLPGGVA